MPLTDEQVKSYLAAADNDNDYGDILKVILFTGLREAEALGLTWDCVDFKKGTLKICKQLQKRPAEAGGFQFATLKNDKTRILRPAPFVMDMLRAVRSKQAERRLQAGNLWQDWIDPSKQYAACRLVFTNALGDHLHPQRLYAHHKKIAAKAGAPDARVHDASDIIGLNQNPVHTGADLVLYFYFQSKNKTNRGEPSFSEKRRSTDYPPVERLFPCPIAFSSIHISKNHAILSRPAKVG